MQTPMQRLKLLPCLALAGCTSLAEQGPSPKEDIAPVIATAATDILKAAEQEKLDVPLEVAGPIAANPISGVPWIVCLKSASPTNTGRPIYSILFKDGKFNAVREAAIVDHCADQVFSPL